VNAWYQKPAAREPTIGHWSGWGGGAIGYANGKKRE